MTSAVKLWPKLKQVALIAAEKRRLQAPLQLNATMCAQLRPKLENTVQCRTTMILVSSASQVRNHAQAYSAIIQQKPKV